MFGTAHAFSGFSSNAIEESIPFYRDTLGLELQEAMGGFRLRFSGGGEVFVYPKPNHEPAGFTVLNFGVADIETAVAELNSRGVVTKIYSDDELRTDERGIARGNGYGPDIAWFRDPAGNVLSVLAES